MEINLVVSVDTSELIPTVRLASWSAPASYHKNNYHIRGAAGDSRKAFKVGPSIYALWKRYTASTAED